MTMKRSTISAFPDPTQPNGAPDPKLRRLERPARPRQNHHVALRALGNRRLEVLWHCL